VSLIFDVDQIVGSGLGYGFINLAETIVTGYLPAEEMIGLAEPIPGPTIQILSDAARSIVSLPSLASFKQLVLKKSLSIA
jgi:hypothetical protein